MQKRSEEPSQHGAALPRQPTDDPNRFLIPTERLPPGFSTRFRSVVGTPSAPVPAATVVLLREDAGTPEALLLRRPTGSGFAPDAWVFPGGRVDASDRSLAHDVMEADRWAARLELGDAREAWAFLVAAVREAWEETGILLADTRGEQVAERLRRARPEVLAGSRSFVELIEGEELRLWLERLVYLGHWVTPPEEPRRYDTRFFLAVTPKGAVEELHGDELVDACWMSPADAVAKYEAGKLRMLPPTVHTLRRLAPFESGLEALEALRAAAAPTFLSRMMPHPDGVMIVVEEEREVP